MRSIKSAFYGAYKNEMLDRMPYNGQDYLFEAKVNCSRAVPLNDKAFNVIKIFENQLRAKQRKNTEWYEDKEISECYVLQKQKLKKLEPSRMVINQWYIYLFSKNYKYG